MEHRENILDPLKKLLEGPVKTDIISRTIYATDASAYRQMPVAVVLPKHKNDLSKLISFARKNKIPLTARGAGTSLAGQVVNKGIVVDYSRYFTEILDYQADKKEIRVQPGVILEEMNKQTLEDQLFFGPETSTANRCNIGGMIGNNACGLHSLVYGSTRDHLLVTEVILSDGSEARFGPLLREDFEQKCKLDGLEGKIYRQIQALLSDPLNQQSIREEFPHPSITRRNTGYALDRLLETDPFTGNGIPFNFSALLAGSEGTLAQLTAATLNLIDRPPQHAFLLCLHLSALEHAFEANLVALKHRPAAVEMMDKTILDLSKKNREQRRNRFFIEGDPEALLFIEFACHSPEEGKEKTEALIHDLQTSGFGYAFPVVEGDDIKRVWALRKAGLGVLSNLKGDARPVSLIEDTAVRVEDLPAYMQDFEKLLKKYDKECVYHAHIGTGELHLRPILNLKEPADLKVFRSLATDTALLVKKYRGSLSGEHGDGRLRSEFIPLMLGDNNYKLIKDIKNCWDPDHLFNPGIITPVVQMDEYLRYSHRQEPMPVITTIQDFSDTGGILRAAEKCNGSGDCRKSHLIGGTMCPSYMASKDEQNTTRARANVLREMLSSKGNKNPYDHPEIYEILDLCLSCKGCKSECPSNVDIAKMKAEFLQHWYDAHGAPLRSKLIANITSFNRLGMLAPRLFNALVSNRFTSGVLKKTLGFAPMRSIPKLSAKTFRRSLKKQVHHLNPANPLRSVYLFIDEFTNYNDSRVGMAAIHLLTRLGYRVEPVKHGLSARTYISKGFLRKAKSIAIQNICQLAPLVTDEKPLIGIEPSAILGFRDEYPDLVGAQYREQARKLSQHTFLLEEFLLQELQAGRIQSGQFTKAKKHILLHGHCQQKALCGTEVTLKALSIPKGYTVEEIPSGCCGMAGSFGYEKEHFDLSMKVGELVLFPAVRKAAPDSLISAPGTSCRHQIADGTGKQAMHPAEILLQALV